MKIETLELMISITRSKMFEMPEHSDIEGLEDDAAVNVMMLLFLILFL